MLVQQKLLLFTFYSISEYVVCPYYKS